MATRKPKGSAKVGPRSPPIWVIAGAQHVREVSVPKRRETKSRIRSSQFETVVEQLLNADFSHELWAAIEKQNSIARKSTVPALRRLAFSDESLSRCAYNFFLKLLASLKFVHPERLLTRKHRNKLAVKISHACGEIVGGLNSIGSGVVVRQSALAKFRFWLVMYLRNPVFNDDNLSVTESKLRHQLLNDAANDITDCLPTLLEQLAQSVDNWGKVEPLVPNPNSVNAARLFFVRNMTEYFSQMHGALFQQQVANLANLYFEGFLTANDVAKLTAKTKRPVKPLE